MIPLLGIVVCVYLIVRAIEIHAHSHAWCPPEPAITPTVYRDETDDQEAIDPTPYRPRNRGDNVRTAAYVLGFAAAIAIIIFVVMAREANDLVGQALSAR